MSRGSKGKAKHNGDGHKSGKNGGSPGSRAQQAHQQKARGDGNGGGSKAKWKKPVPPGTKRCRHCGGNLTPGNRAKHERRGADGVVFYPCAPVPLVDLPPDPVEVVTSTAAAALPTGKPKPAAMQAPPKPAPAPKPAEWVGTWGSTNQWNCKKPGCMKTGCYDTEETCYGGCGCKRPSMNKRPAASAAIRTW